MSNNNYYFSLTENERRILQHNLSYKKETCVSIIVPTFVYWPQRRSNSNRLNKAIDQAKKEIDRKCEEKTIKQLHKEIDDLLKETDLASIANGMGIFISKDIKEIIPFYDQAYGRILVDDIFLIREILQQSFYDASYLVLHISEKGSKLYRGHRNRLSEIDDFYFPIHVDTQYEYTPPSHNSSFMGRTVVKGFENEKTTIYKKHLIDLIRQTDQKLHNYITPDTIFIIVGTIYNVSAFTHYSNFSNRLSGSVMGNYEHMPQTEWSERVWEVFKAFTDQSKSLILQNFREKTGEGMTLTGIKSITAAINEGNCETILIESGFSNNKIEHLLVEAIKHSGRVVIIENGSLGKHRIGLITRYPTGKLSFAESHHHS